MRISIATAFIVLAVFSPLLRAVEITIPTPKDFYALSFSADGKYLYAGGDATNSSTYNTVLWKINSRSGKLEGTFDTSSPSQVISISTSSDCRVLVGSQNCDSVVFDANGKKINSFRQFWSPGPDLTLACFLPGGRILIGSSKPCHAFFENDLTTNRTIVHPISGVKWSQNCATSTENGDLVAFNDSEVITVMTKYFTVSRGHYPIKRPPLMMAFAAIPSTVAVVYEDNAIELLDIRDPEDRTFRFKKIREANVGGSEATSIRPIPGGGFVLSTVKGEVIALNDKLEVIARVKTPELARINAVAVNADGSLIALHSAKTGVRIMQSPWTK